MREIKYKIIFLSDWHVSSGLDAGAYADLLVLKDENDLPFIPGKTIKGILRDAAWEISQVAKISEKQINRIFGGGEENINAITGNVYFSNAYINEQEAKEIVSNNLNRYLYRTFVSTKINSEGIAEEKSLRTIEVTIPLTLFGTIRLYEKIEGAENLLEQTMKWTRYIGLNRNRGLGRCKFKIIEK